MLTRADITDIACVIKELRDDPILANNEDENRTVQLTLNVLAIRLGTLFALAPVTYYDRRQWHELCGNRSLNDRAGDAPEFDENWEKAWDDYIEFSGG
jgi:hypothetical protein